MKEEKKSGALLVIGRLDTRYRIGGIEQRWTSLT